VAIRDQVVRLSHRAGQALDLAMQALRDSNGPLAQQLILDDAQINRLRYDIEQQCYRLLLLKSPASKDLRAVIAALHISAELERAADYAMGIAKLTLRMEQSVILKPSPAMGQLHLLTKAALEEAVQSYIQWDAESAAKIMARDAALDELDQKIGQEWIAQMRAKPKLIQSATYMIWIAHNLERIADRAVGICERVIFMATGDIQGH
jgi:phosphate transport system protein